MVTKGDAHKPTTPGWYKFRGLRYTPSGKYIVTVDDVVKVINGHATGTYLVLTAGSAQRYSSEVYEGEWEALNVTSPEPA